MLDLTVSVDLFHPASAFYWGCAILFGILPFAGLIRLLFSKGTDKKSMNVAKVTSVVIMACLFVGLPILSAGSRAEGT